MPEIRAELLRVCGTMPADTAVAMAVRRACADGALTRHGTRGGGPGRAGYRYSIAGQAPTPDGRERSTITVSLPTPGKSQRVEVIIDHVRRTLTPVLPSHTEALGLHLSRPRSDHLAYRRLVATTASARHESAGNQPTTWRWLARPRANRRAGSVAPPIQLRLSTPLSVQLAETSAAIGATRADVIERCVAWALAQGYDPAGRVVCSMCGGECSALSLTDGRCPDPACGAVIGITESPPAQPLT